MCGSVVPFGTFAPLALKFLGSSHFVVSHLAGYVFNFAHGCCYSASLGGSAARVKWLSPLTMRTIRSRWSLGRQPAGAFLSPMCTALCSLKGFCALNKSKKFKLSLVALIVCIIGFQFSTPSINFYTNPFYIGSFIFAIALLVIAVNFTCPNCRKNQVALSLKQFRLPSNTCCNCGYSVGKNGTE